MSGNYRVISLVSGSNFAASNLEFPVLVISSAITPQVEGSLITVFIWAHCRHLLHIGSMSAMRLKWWFVWSADKACTQPEIASHNTGIQLCSRFITMR